MAFRFQQWHTAPLLHAIYRITHSAQKLITCTLTSFALPLVLWFAWMIGECVNSTITMLVWLPGAHWQSATPGPMSLIILQCAAFLFGLLAIARYLNDGRNLKVALGYVFFVVDVALEPIRPETLVAADDHFHFRLIGWLLYGNGDPRVEFRHTDVLYSATEKTYWMFVSVLLSAAEIVFARRAVASIAVTRKLRIKMTVPFVVAAFVTILVIGPNEGWYFVEQFWINRGRRMRKGQDLPFCNPTLHLIVSTGSLIAGKLEALPGRSEAAFDHLKERMGRIRKRF